MSSVSGKRVAIVGGGPGGLTLARLLQVQGVRVAVFERDTNHASRNQGATLDLHHDSGLKALEAAHLMGAFRENYRVGADKVVLVDQHANIVPENFGGGEGGPERPEIDRGPLRDLLLASLLPGTVMWDRQFATLDRIAGQVHLHFVSGETETADLIVAADGVNSRIRPFITPIRPVYSGITIVEGNVYGAATAAPEIHALIGEGKICALGGGNSLFIGAKGDGSLAFYTGCEMAERWFETSGIDLSSRAEMLAWFKREFLDWSPMWDVLFENAASPFHIRPQYFFPLDQTWETLPDLTMIGDAAHAMPPYAGEGVNMAMLDALELAKALLSDSFPDLASAIASFETGMRKRAAETTATTLMFTEAFHADDAISRLMEVFRNHTADEPIEPLRIQSS